MPNVEERLIREDKHWLYYERYVDGRLQGEFMKLKEPLWFLGRSREVLAMFGVDVDQETADQLEDVFPGVDKYYYLYYLSTHDYKEAIKWIMGPIATAVTKTGDPISRICPPYRLGEFVDALAGDKFPKHFAKEIFNRVLNDDGLSLKQIIADPKYAPVDMGVVDAAIAAVIAANPEKAEEAKANPKMIQWFVGQTLKANKGLSPILVKEILEKQLAA